ncbi:SDR family NAD(P)-dependent oxidoreductase [Yinghuangia soli]|uniref:SDR family NAD(P)-dependent oxidoreductase n=1 Tax=Yinghuangia soli TaxID=2908204 RepID=A0AA41Q4C2_9ACTN|nr:SDR family NAD(P)-dependent oxidoreductase [Yinghuangia soli]MCF2530962.1 SDR family NAD(P)-dependent oxidoreductase [Yinghuangia soli]
MTAAARLDQALDRSIALGYGTPGFRIRKRLAGWPADGGRMDGKTVLVTGAAGGIGLAAATGFARCGATVYVLGRTADRAEQAVRRVRAAAPGAAQDAVRPLACDVGRMADLHTCTAELLDREARLDVLVNNAGVMPGTRQFSADGVELTFAVHVLGPWILTATLLPLLRAAAPSRVVTVTSGGQYTQGLTPGDPEGAAVAYSPKKFYARTKRAQVVLTEEWAERLAAFDVHVHAMHPGWADTKGVQDAMPLFRRLTRPVLRDAEQGADTIVWLGAAPEAVRTTGLLWQDRKPRPATYALGARRDSEAARSELWAYTAALARQGGFSAPV